MIKKERRTIVAAAKTTYKVVAPAGVFIRSTPDQAEDNVVRLAKREERLVVVNVGDEWLQTDEGFVMNQPYIVEPDTVKPRKKGEAE
jgi:hypothetical protein|nr:MAG TPA: hypothetical protein [Caudoviricetes sp.]DAX54153.1 MAG TPA: hypothetical protein [Caudoviricetes sp.]DAY35203.1 MAG TPA: hypothetical protein [Caudoviricetes sp.]